GRRHYRQGEHKRHHRKYCYCFYHVYFIHEYLLFVCINADELVIVIERYESAIDPPLRLY
ncbi:MAG: hypothetical protein KAR25_09045, partial [Methanosarcinales archaeon]|nr:hypothetical protein [Methanosarcinales archaeon]